MVEKLSNLRDLQVLQLEVVIFNLPDLVRLSQRLKRLRLISTNLTEIIAMPAVEDLKESFEGLKVFLFWTQANQANRRAFTRFCIENIPTLQVVGDFANEFCTVNDFYLNAETLIWPGSSDLRHFTLDLNYEIIPTDLHTRFKKINHLKIIWTNQENSDDKKPFRNEELLKKFKKITSLDLLGVPYSTILSRFLNKNSYGSTLLALHVTEVGNHHVGLTYNQVFKDCTKLEKLFLDVDDSAQRITEKFPPLKELKLNLQRFKRNSRTLWDVLKAPKLEKIELMGELTYPEDLDKLQPLLARHPRSLRKLKTLIVNLGWTDDTDRIEEKKVSFEKTSRFLKVAMEELKGTLTGVKFSLNDSCEFLQLFNCIENAATIMEIVTSLGPSFQNVNSGDFYWLYDEELIDYLISFRIIHFTT
ncbi:uncharacterized protein LOC135937924 [Cloeon dipterum]|uniref:uncharacterized protein LOC135937924 n=1 Tax=Cloeon dipterum TaxID=197152 RepID=UPI0032204C96